MPIYDYVCGSCSTRFERLVPSWGSPAPECPACEGPTRRRPPAPAIRRGVAPPVARSQAPRSWEGVGNGDREVITNWRRALDVRREFEGRHPEHAEHQEAVAAHEGVFERRPLTYRELAERATGTNDANQAAADAVRARTPGGTIPAAG
ncbi:FmdB family zinc ribbon protein [Streptomyces sp. S1D4-11]|nr:zinc ribbon domain-containing protein [Streptomyces sp. S1D4-11]QIZ01160.1 zinc ribbon domain-containing protein [Streptomyces sp. S1D4-11]